MKNMGQATGIIYIVFHPNIAGDPIDLLPYNINNILSYYSSSSARPSISLTIFLLPKCCHFILYVPIQQPSLF